MSIAIRSSLIRSLVIGASLVVIIAGLRAASPILSPLLLALFLAVRQLPEGVAVADGIRQALKLLARP